MTTLTREAAARLFNLNKCFLSKARQISSEVFDGAFSARTRRIDNSGPSLMAFVKICLGIFAQESKDEKDLANSCSVMPFTH